MSCETGAFEAVQFSVLDPKPAKGNKHDSALVHGYATGYAQGIRAAEAAARVQRETAARAATAVQATRDAEHADAIAALRAAAAALHARTVPVLEKASTVLVESALLLAERIVRAELSNHRFGAKAALDRAMDGVDAPTVRQVRMNPEDLALMGLDTVPGTDIALIPDPSLARGDAVTAFDEGFLDARIATALERASNALRSRGE